MKPLKTLHLPGEQEPREIFDAYAREKIQKLSADTPILDTDYDPETGIITYNNSPAFNEWLTEEEGEGRFVPSGLVSHIIVDPTSDANLDAQLKAIFDGMSNDTVEYCAMRSSGATTTFGGGRVTFEIFKQVGGYGVIKATKYYENTQVQERQRLIFNNGWHEWDWVNPPMQVGGEYRTTERHHGKVVYTMTLDFGSLPNNSTKSVNAPAGVAQLVDLSGIAYQYGATQAIHLIFSIGTCDNLAEVWFDRSGQKIYARTTADLTNRQVFLILKYTKN